MPMIKKSLIEEFRNIVGRENALCCREALRAYSYDSTTNWVHEPDLTLFPTGARQVSAIMKIANAERIPVTPRGGGTNGSGGSVPIRGGIVVCTTKMNRILQIDKGYCSATVEPGVVLCDLNSNLAKEGLFFPPDPQSLRAATIGGMIAENAGGPACVKYGVTKQYILGLEVVLPTADIVYLGGRTLNAGAGYDLMHLVIGSEGTLGIVTKAELRLRLLPPFFKTVMAAYNDAAAAGETVFRVFANGIVPNKIEYMDNWIINRIEEMMPIGLPKDADAILLFQSDGGIEEAVEKEASKIVEIAIRHGAREAKAAKDQAEADRYWAARAAGFAATFGKTKTVFAEDVTVPRPRIPDLIKKCKEISKKYNVEVVVLGHAGDGNFHPAVLTDINNTEHYGRALRAVEEIIQSAVDLEGVISGEHGIGLEKQRFFDEVVDPVAVGMMKSIKRLFDPNDVMNPGKIWR